jgi:hypothetical protein|nr:MAG TPA: hypothetical protein [Bacteriophage sp.]
MNKLQAMRGRIVEIAEENGWEVDIKSNDGDNFSYEFSQGSPAGQDFSFESEMEDNNVYTLLNDIRDYYDCYDCSYEAYLWLDKTGHGTNGAPYDMKDVYEDMEACEKMIFELWKSLSEEDWEKYYEY